MSYSYQPIRSECEPERSNMRILAAVLGGAIVAVAAFAVATPASAAYASTATRQVPQVQAAVRAMPVQAVGAYPAGADIPGVAPVRSLTSATPVSMTAAAAPASMGVSAIWTATLALFAAAVGYYVRRSEEPKIAMASLFGKREEKMIARAGLSSETMRIQGSGLEFPNLNMRNSRMPANFRETYPKFFNKLDEIFPGSLFELSLLAKSTKVLNTFGFNKENTIPLVAVCRDELTRPLLDDLEDMWGESFAMGSIAGMVFMGRTGMGAGTAHAPQNPDGVERYFFISAPHIGITGDGTVGYCLRPGQHGDSTACGALCALLGELKKGNLNVQVNTIDMEQSMMKQQVVGRLKYGEVPELQDLTKAAQNVIQDQLEAILKNMNLKGKAEYAFLTGIQVHGPENSNFFWPKEFYIIKVDGSRVDLDVASLPEVDASELEEVQHAAEFAKVTFVVQQGDLASVKRWVQLGSDVNEQDSDGETALLVACRNGHVDIVRFLLENGANPKLATKQGRSPLQEAVEAGHDEICALLSKAGCILAQNVAEFYLWRAAREGNLTLAKRTVQYGPPDVVNTRNQQGDSPLFASIRLRNVDVAKYLISIGANYTGSDIDGNTVEKMVRVRGYTDLEEQLFGIRA